jgi:hypothetical protein
MGLVTHHPIRAMPTPARIVLALGVLGLTLALVNQLLAGPPGSLVPPPLERASVLASLEAVLLMLVAILWTRAQPQRAEPVIFDAPEGFELAPDLDGALRQELAWGTAMLLTATPAASLLVVWDSRVLCRRGRLGAGPFQEGPISERCRSRGRPIGLVNLALYPGAAEFSYLPRGVPAVLLQPLGRRGLVILGGWAPRCFSSSDERWLEGWAERLRTQWLEAIPGGAEGEEPEGSGEREEPAAPSSPADRVPPP